MDEAEKGVGNKNWSGMFPARLSLAAGEKFMNTLQPKGTGT